MGDGGVELHFPTIFFHRLSSVTCVFSSRKVTSISHQQKSTEAERLIVKIGKLLTIPQPDNRCAAVSAWEEGSQNESDARTMRLSRCNYGEKLRQLDMVPSNWDRLRTVLLVDDGSLLHIHDDGKLC